MNIEELRREAEEGSLVAATILGICYLDGYLVEQDYAAAQRLLELPANQGVPRAVSNLARMYGEGLGMPKDAERAFRMHDWAASRGEFYSLVALARMYARGDGVAADPKRARELYESVLGEDVDLAGCAPELEEARAYLKSRD